MQHSLLETCSRVSQEPRNSRAIHRTETKLELRTRGCGAAEGKGLQAMSAGVMAHSTARKASLEARPGRQSASGLPGFGVEGSGYRVQGSGFRV